MTREKVYAANNQQKLKNLNIWHVPVCWNTVIIYYEWCYLLHTNNLQTQDVMHLKVNVQKESKADESCLPWFSPQILAPVKFQWK